MLGAKTFEVFLVINGLLGTILVGTAVGTFFNGAHVFVERYEPGGLANTFPRAGSSLNLSQCSAGTGSIFPGACFGTHCILFLQSTTIRLLLVRKNNCFTIQFLFWCFFLYFLIWLLLKEGFAVNPDTGEVFMEEYKYLHNVLQMPLNTALLLLGVVGVLWGIISTLFMNSNKGFWFAGTGTVFTVFALFIIAGFNNTAFYPSVYDLQSSLNHSKCIIQQIHT